MMSVSVSTLERDDTNDSVEEALKSIYKSSAPG
jgi:hypothetical protein